MRTTQALLLALLLVTVTSGTASSHGPGGLPPSMPPPTSPVRPPMTPPQAPSSLQQQLQQQQQMQQQQQQADEQQVQKNRAETLQRVRGVVNDVLKDNRWRDNFVATVANGGSCVEASERRARDIINALQKLQNAGKLGDLYIKVGTRSGYQTNLPDWVPLVGGRSSWHTYTVVEIQDGTGKRVDTIEADNYLFVNDIDDSGDMIGPPTPANWSDPWTKSTGSSGTPPPSPPSPTPAPKGQMQTGPSQSEHGPQQFKK